jgi:hypothetical protein
LIKASALRAAAPAALAPGVRPWGPTRRGTAGKAQERQPDDYKRWRRSTDAQVKIPAAAPIRSSVA